MKIWELVLGMFFKISYSIILLGKRECMTKGSREGRGREKMRLREKERREREREKERERE